MSMNMGEIGHGPGTWRISCSLTWMDYAIGLSNGPTGSQPWYEKTFRIVGSELCFALIVVASLVETVFRSFFTLPGLMFTFPHCLPQRVAHLIDEVTFIGPILSFLNTWVALAALVKNFIPGRLEYNSILPCTQTVYHCLPHLCCCYEVDDD
ncbi:MAG: hypothetical protein ACHQT8_01145 [Chlamydiales bacterium]